VWDIRDRSIARAIRKSGTQKKEVREKRAEREGEVSGRGRQRESARDKERDVTEMIKS
jgi:hypothetical protein